MSWTSVDVALHCMRVGVGIIGPRDEMRLDERMELQGGSLGWAAQANCYRGSDHISVDANANTSLVDPS